MADELEAVPLLTNSRVEIATREQDKGVDIRGRGTPGGGGGGVRAWVGGGTARSP